MCNCVSAIGVVLISLGSQNFVWTLTGHHVYESAENFRVLGVLWAVVVLLLLCFCFLVLLWGEQIELEDSFVLKSVIGPFVFEILPWKFELFSTYLQRGAGFPGQTGH